MARALALRLAALSALAGALGPSLLGCSWESVATDAQIARCHRVPGDPGSGIVAIDDEGRFVAGETRFVPRGVGSYPLLEHAGHGRMEEVGEILDTAVALGRPLVRTLAFFDGGESPARIRNDDGTLREEGLAALDRVLAAAAERGVRLILVLANHWSDYGGARAVLRMVAPGEILPVEAFYTDERAIAAQRAYVTALVARRNTVNGRPYAADPAIFAWELVNEARCDDEARCDAHTLPDWATDMTEAIRDAGAEQLVSWGGAGHELDHQESIGVLAEDGDVDVITLHLYPQLGGPIDLGADGGSARPLTAIAEGTRVIERIADIAETTGRAMLLEEIGWRGEDAERALVLGAWMRVARARGVGTLPWMIAETGRPDYDGFLIRPERDRATREALECE